MKSDRNGIRPNGMTVNCDCSRYPTHSAPKSCPAVPGRNESSSWGGFTR
jgi:hypothetical protein